MSIFFRFSNQGEESSLNNVVSRDNFKSISIPTVQEGDIVFQNAKQFKVSTVKENGKAYKTEVSKSFYLKETVLEGSYQILVFHQNL